MAYVLPLGNRWALMRNLRCPKERKANEEWRLCVNLRNNLYINLHIFFHDGTIWPKYAILSDFIQSLDIQ